MPDSDESLRQYMQEETAQELGSVQRHFALLAFTSLGGLGVYGQMDYFR
jgi:hypothetical protein